MNHWVITVASGFVDMAMLQRLAELHSAAGDCHKPGTAVGIYWMSFLPMLTL